ncbi:MAG: GNAT family N-acetyltransferase [Amaricoccus sp.]|uniref:GNAT family N-acetyltransferase n=1 Tax=Amaricoccus sp. TaxID=1872485 RepID=UPI0039E3D6BB
MTPLLTPRLRLRRWEPRDAVPFAALNADPEVMRHFPAPLDRAASDALVERLERAWSAAGIGFAAVERRSDGVLIGMVGLNRLALPEIGPPQDGALEVGWRLARAHWGQGYATEAARAWIDHGFATFPDDEIAAIIVPANLASQAVARRLGMRPQPSLGFEHPRIPEGHHLRRHLFFTLPRRA